MSEVLLNKILTKVINIEDKLDSFATQEQVTNATSEVLDDIDRFVKLHETLDHELVALRHKYERLEERIARLELDAVSA